MPLIWARIDDNQLRCEIAQVCLMTDRPFVLNLFILPPHTTLSSRAIDAVAAEHGGS